MPARDPGPQPTRSRARGPGLLTARGWLLLAAITVTALGLLAMVQP